MSERGMTAKELRDVLQGLSGETEITVRLLHTDEEFRVVSFKRGGDTFQISALGKLENNVQP